MLMLIGAWPGLPMPPYEVGKVLYGDAVGEVVASDNPALRKGDLVMHRDRQCGIGAESRSSDR